MNWLDLGDLDLFSTYHIIKTVQMSLICTLYLLNQLVDVDQPYTKTQMDIGKNY